MRNATGIVVLAGVLLGAEAQARYFMPRTGNFLSADRAGMIDGPNQYAYARSNPVLFIDPTGETALVVYGDPGAIRTQTAGTWRLSDGNRKSFETALVAAVQSYVSDENKNDILVESWFAAIRDPSRFDEKGINEVLYVGHGDLDRPLLRPLPDKPIDVVDFAEFVKKVSSYGVIHVLGCNTVNTGFAQSLANQTRIVEAVDNKARFKVDWNSNFQVTGITLMGNTVWYQAGFNVNLRPHPPIVTPP